MPVLVSPEVENAGAVTEPAAGRTGAVILAEPLMLCPQIVLAVPQFAVVMLADPLKDVPFIVLAVCRVVAVVAVVALPDNAPVKVGAVIAKVDVIAVVVMLSLETPFVVKPI